MDTTPLFRPFHHGQLSLPNRIVMAPMTRRFSPGGVPGADVVEYYRRRAAGGVGLIITEGTTINRAAASDNTRIPNFHAPESIAGWQRVVQAVHAEGGKIAPQLWHQGLARAAGAGPHPEAPSDGPTAVDERSHAMTDADIADTIAAFAAAAATARQLGFDAVELHGAHGYLIDQFLWATTNRREDRFGGNPGERTRFAAEVVRAVRAATGSDFPLILRFSQWKLQDYGARLADTPQELERVLAPLVDAGVDIFHASTRRFWQAEFAGSDLNLAGWARKLTGRPAISVGSVGLAGPDFTEQVRGQSSEAPIGSLDDLLRRMEANEFDLVTVGRALISNPDWATKVREGRFDQLHAFRKTDLATLA
ncbi:NADH:flavin oxidoreductase [Dyella sp. C9]|uniref:NADH:flavin oxidoreductase n=1 Tax=Dyella sp. C9 TaxID=2202154 RepID=UPI000DF01CD5|nr:NADH:flavin oxidoreductase [Dyella sp. C9]